MCNVKGFAWDVCIRFSGGKRALRERYTAHQEPWNGDSWDCGDAKNI